MDAISTSSRRLLLLLAATLWLTLPGRAADQWIRLRTPDFEMYTTHSEKSAVETLEAFEQVQAFFRATFDRKTPKSPIRIIAFRSEQEYAPYRIRQSASAYYLHGPRRDYIVLQDLGQDHFQAVFHEYAHFVLEYDGLRLPTWLNEGLADFYSSLETSGEKTIVGKPISGRLYALKHQPWVDLSALLASGQDSPYYNQRNTVQSFYAESWGLTHMLMLSDSYKANAKKFVRLVGSGVESAQAFETIYGKSVEDVKRDLQGYIERDAMPVSKLDVSLEGPALEPEVAAVDGFQAEFVLADLLASNGSASGTAEARLNALKEQRPDDAGIEECLGYLAWLQNRKSDALNHFRRAANLNSTDPMVLYHYATLAADANAAESEVMPALVRAVSLNPGFDDARLQLGFSAMRSENYSMAVDNLKEVHQIKPENLFALNEALSYCNYELQRYDEARRSAELALDHADAPGEREQAETLLNSIAAGEKRKEMMLRASVSVPVPPPAAAPKVQKPNREAAKADAAADTKRVDGNATRIDCLGSRVRLHIRVGSKLMTFELKDPNSVVVRSTSGGAYSMVCGPQKPYRVGVVYSNSGHPRAGLDGEARELYL